MNNIEAKFQYIVLNLCFPYILCFVYPLFIYVSIELFAENNQRKVTF